MQQKWELLYRGYEINATVRDLQKIDDIKKALQDCSLDISKVNFYKADLLDENWSEAMEGCEEVMHVASPTRCHNQRMKASY